MPVIDGLEAVEIPRCNLGHDAEPEVLFNKAGFAYCRCPECGLVWVNPQLTNESVAHIYTTGFNAKLTQRQRPGSFLAYRPVLRQIAGYNTQGRLLDVGCFTGNFLLAAREAGWSQVEGTEISMAAITYAREEHGLTVHEGDLTSLTLPGGYDVITLSDVIEHVSDPKATIDAIYGLLRPGGLLYMDTPHFFSVPYLRFGRDWSVFFPWHRTYFSVKNMRIALEDAGFRVKTIKAVGILPWSRYDAYAAHKSGYQGGQSSHGSLKNRGFIQRNKDLLRPIWLSVKAAQEIPFHLLSALGIHIGAKLIVYAERP